MQRSDKFFQIMNEGQLALIPSWVSVHPEEINAASANGWTVLHKVAQAEAEGIDISNLPDLLLAAGADPHQADMNGDTSFNIAAPNSPVCGRIMTHHWLAQALESRGQKALNDLSGSHGSSLSQYIAKWFLDDEIEFYIDQAVRAGMRADIANRSGWTPLIAAAATGRIKAVEVLVKHYGLPALTALTTESYTARYKGFEVTFPEGASAFDVAWERLEQDDGLSAEMQRDLQKCMLVLARVLNPMPAPGTAPAP
jgi:hypothetical protein